MVLLVESKPPITSLALVIILEAPSVLEVLVLLDMDLQDIQAHIILEEDILLLVDILEDTLLVILLVIQPTTLPLDILDTQVVLQEDTMPAHLINLLDILAILTILVVMFMEDINLIL